MLAVASHMRRRFYFMAAWQAFQGHRGFDGWLLQRHGAFSVDREGCDRRAVKQAIELLRTGNVLVVFPEGEIHHLNERLMPLLDGVAFMALAAQRELADAGTPVRVCIVPTAIRYHFVEDVRPSLEAAMARLEARLFWWKPPPGASLPERILRFGEALLTIKEKEKLGRSGENDGDLPTRIGRVIDALLERHEAEHGGRAPSADSVPLRVKALRRKLLELRCADTTDEPTRRKAQDALDDVQLALQLYSYPGNYLTEQPTLERMAETIEKFEEDVFGVARSLGSRRALVRFADPIDMKQHVASGRARTAVTTATDRLERAIAELLATTGSQT